MGVERLAALDISEPKGKCVTELAILTTPDGAARFAGLHEGIHDRLQSLHRR